MPTKRLPLPEILRNLLDVDPKTGRLWWRSRPVEMFESTKHQKRVAATWNSRWAGKEALTNIDNHGYRRGAVLGIDVRAHRVVWALVHGQWPEGEIDHVNGNRQDNRLKNLRCVPRTENRRNQKTPLTNTSGCIGVYFRTDTQKWEAKIGVNGKMISAGCFDSFEQAAQARKQAEIKYGFHPNHGRR